MERASATDTSRVAWPFAPLAPREGGVLRVRGEGADAWSPGTTVERGLGRRLASGLRVALDRRCAGDAAPRVPAASELRPGGPGRAHREGTAVLDGARRLRARSQRRPARRRPARARLDELQPPAEVPDVRPHAGSHRWRERARRLARGRLVPGPHRLRRRTVGPLRNGCRAAGAARAHHRRRGACRRPPRLDVHRIADHGGRSLRGRDV